MFPNTAFLFFILNAMFSLFENKRKSYADALPLNVNNKPYLVSVGYKVIYNDV